MVLSREDAESAAIPLADVALVLFGLKAKMGGALIQQCASFDVVLLFCDWRGVPLGAFYPWASHTRIGARQLAQASLSVPRKKNAWGRIVAAKVRGQAANLKSLKRPGLRTLSDLAAKVRSGDPDNLEAQAAKAYWPKVFGDRGFSRQPGLGTGTNALLDYGYAILRGFAIRAVAAAGLSPALGLFHRGRSNPFNLADDLIEPFRPAVDWTVATLPEEASPNHPAVKQALVAVASLPLSQSGVGIAGEMTNLAQALGRYVEGDIDRLQVSAWTPPTRQLDG